MYCLDKALKTENSSRRRNYLWNVINWSAHVLLGTHETLNSVLNLIDTNECVEIGNYVTFTQKLKSLHWDLWSMKDANNHDLNIMALDNIGLFFFYLTYLWG